jgi:hypothetical protein
VYLDIRLRAPRFPVDPFFEPRCSATDLLESNIPVAHVTALCANIPVAHVTALCANIPVAHVTALCANSPVCQAIKPHVSSRVYAAVVVAGIAGF